MESPTPLSHCLTVTQLNEEIREHLEEGFPYIQVRGEVADWKIPPSGHIYFTLMDAQSRIRAIIWRATRVRLTTLPKSGDAVFITGRIALYAPRGEYQLIVEALRPDGAGGEREKMVRLHAQLSQEGLFDAARKRPLPLLPATIGVVTSASGAAIHDITRTLDRRFPGYHLILAHAKVQGEGADLEIVNALQQLIQDGQAEVILCGRGGGSAEDLAPFNSEIVVRAIAESPIPIISAVGHEIDITLADLAADARASTPSAAAELAIPEQTLLNDQLHALRSRLTRALTTQLSQQQSRFNALTTRVIHPRRRIDQSRLRCDELEQRLTATMHRVLKQHQQAQQQATARLNDWSHNRPLALITTHLQQTQARLMRAIHPLHQRQQEKYRSTASRLAALSPLNVLTRGYALVQDTQGQAIRSTQTVQIGSTLRVILAQGELSVAVTAIKESK